VQEERYIVITRKLQSLDVLISAWSYIGDGSIIVNKINYLLQFLKLKICVL